MIEVLVADHRAVERLFTALESGTGTPRARRHLVDVIVAELSRHTVVEERFLYPVVRTLLDAGDRIADHEIGAHVSIERALHLLSKLDVADDLFGPLATALVAAVRQHVREEETELFPVLRTACEPDRLRDLGQRMHEAKELAPTRPHPRAPHTPPWNRMLGPLIGVTDKMRDELSDRRTHPEELPRDGVPQRDLRAA
jgi:hemerythrin-like domain-containing protein